MLNRIVRRLKEPLILASAATLAANAALTPMTEPELSEVNGQALMTVDVTEAGSNLPGTDDGTGNPVAAAHDFVKITTGLEVQLNANARRITLGAYNRGTTGTHCDGNSDVTDCFADIDMEYVSLGTVDPSTGRMTHVTMIDPYIELALEDVGGKRQLRGLRLGAAYQEGILSAKNNIISGNIKVNAYPTGVLGAAVPPPTLYTYRPDGTQPGYPDQDSPDTFAARSTLVRGYAPVPLIGERTVENPLVSAPKLNIEGARNFWLALSAERINYPNHSCAMPGGCQYQTDALPGFWINLADNVSARDLTQTDDSADPLGVVFDDIFGNRDSVIPARFNNQFPVNCWNGLRQATHGGANLTDVSEANPLCIP